MNKYFKKSIISTAVILAAGNSTRLSPFTNDLPKCLIEVNGIPILCQTIDSLRKYEFKKIILVVGYLADKIIKVVQNTERWRDLKIEFVFNESYSTTNNIYSLWLIRNLIKESFVLLESDLVFDSFLLEKILVANRIAIADYNPAMTGTTVKLNNSGLVDKMMVGEVLDESSEIKKTVNIYSFSLSSWNLISKELNQRISKGLHQDFYEIAISTLIEEGNLILQGINFDAGRWYEIDTIDDLKNAEKLFISDIITM